MAVSTISGIRLAGVASAVPTGVRDYADAVKVFGEDAASKIAEMSGIRRRHVAPEDGAICTSDLCFKAAQSLLSELGWTTSTIDALIFVSQTPDYILPATSCMLQARLGLPKSCAALDVNLGCSGYVYGLWLAAQMATAGNCRRVLLLVGDTISRIAAKEDRSVAPLFGDAGTATALEQAPEGSQLMTFELGSDGTGARNLIVPAGGFRNPRTEQTRVSLLRSDGNCRSDEDLFMSGADIFAFTLKEVPPLILRSAEARGWSLDEVDGYVLHQANRFMLQQIAKRSKIPKDRLILGLEEFGNTSSASIPLAMSSRLREKLSCRSLKLILAGFGVGFSWASVALTCGPMVMPQVIEVAELGEKRAYG